MGAPLTILYITGYGAHEWALHTPRFLAQRGHRVALACPTDSPMERMARQAGMDVHDWKAPLRLTETRSIAGAVNALYRLFRRQRPDVVVSYALPISLWARLAARLAGVPVRLFKPPSLWDLELPLLSHRRVQHCLDGQRDPGVEPRAGALLSAGAAYAHAGDVELLRFSARTV
jgi:hypothetical protein